jgi:hypothetical protein
LINKITKPLNLVERAWLTSLLAPQRNKTNLLGQPQEHSVTAIQTKKQ